VLLRAPELRRLRALVLRRVLSVLLLLRGWGQY
jgi:hypothetical protein